MEENLCVAHAVHATDIGSFDRFFSWFDSTATENAVFILRNKPNATPAYHCWYNHNAENDKSY
jgi:hypothetical protein